MIIIKWLRHRTPPIADPIERPIISRLQPFSMPFHPFILDLNMMLPFKSGDRSFSDTVFYSPKFPRSNNTRFSACMRAHTASLQKWKSLEKFTSWLAKHFTHLKSYGIKFMIFFKYMYINKISFITLAVIKGGFFLYCYFLFSDHFLNLEILFQSRIVVTVYFHSYFS
jgi:hypothetical protein